MQKSSDFKNNDLHLKFAILTVVLFLSLILTAAVHINNKTGLVYTHFFYLPIILTAIWFGSAAIFLAVFFGFLHILTDYLVLGSISPAPFWRALFFLAVALLIRYLSKSQNAQQKILENNLAFIHQAYLGNMVNHVAHEIRNPLTTVKGYLQFFKERKEYEPYLNTFDIIIEDIDHTDKFIQHCLMLSPDKFLNLQEHNLSIICNQVEALVKDKCHENEIRIVKDIRITPDFLMDEAEIRHLVLNLFNNAIEAMPHGGELKISVFQSGLQICLAISDTGCGIPAQIIPSLGLPFNSTKDDHVGLGLAVSFSIARRHRAQIKFETGKNGTTVETTFKL